MKDRLRIGVLSDLHAHDSRIDGAGGGRFLDVSTSLSSFTVNPIAGLFRLIEKKELRADVLLCGGDISDKAQQTAAQMAWQWVIEVGSRLKASTVVGTPGNHDLDSRHLQNKFDPKGLLQQLLPSFPIPGDQRLNDMFWSRHFSYIDSEDLRIVTLNSAAFHGGAEGELTHGRIADYTLNNLNELLGSLHPKRVNIILCHHHPLKHRELLEDDDYEVMKNGEILLDMLSDPSMGEWMVIHGHRHVPRIRYASGGNWQPIVFSAGSFSGQLYPGNTAANQFYIIEFRLEPGCDVGLAGYIEAWDWHLGKGWQPASSQSGLPHKTGFGWRGSLRQLADKVAAALTEPAVKWATMVLRVPELEYLMERDIRALAHLLALSQKNIVFNEYGCPNEIGIGD
jgi:hypothetical protein